MMQKTLAERLRVLRAQRGLTLVEAAEKTGIGRDTLSDLERGRRHPVMPTLTKIAQGYDVPVEELLEEPVLAGKPEAPGGEGPATEQDSLSLSVINLPDLQAGEERRGQLAGLHALAESLRTVRRWSLELIKRDGPQTPGSMAEELAKLHEDLFMEGFESYRLLKARDDAAAGGLPELVRALEDLLTASSEIQEIAAEQDPGSVDEDESDELRKRRQQQHEALRRFEAG